MAYCGDHGYLYFDHSIRTQKAESLLSLIMASYTASEGEDRKVEIANNLKSAYDIYKKDGSGSYNGSTDKFNSHYTLGLEFGIWEDENLTLNPLAKQVAQSKMKIEEYMDIVLLNYVQPVKGKIVHLLYHLLSYMKQFGKDIVTKEDIKKAYENVYDSKSNETNTNRDDDECYDDEAISEEDSENEIKNDVNKSDNITGAINVLLASNYFEREGQDKSYKLKYVYKKSIDDLIISCNKKYLCENGYENAKQEIGQKNSDYVEYLLTQPVVPSDNKNLFKYFLDNVVVSTRTNDFLKSESKKAYLTALDSLSSSIAELNNISENSIYDINDRNKLDNIRELPIFTNDIKKKDSNGSGTIPRSVALYEYFLAWKPKQPEMFPIQQIYFGAPGNGKSYSIFKKIAIHSKKIEPKDGLDEATKENLENSPFIFRTTFHPDTDYQSFVGAYKPVMNGDGIAYQFIPQVFTKAYVAAWNNPTSNIYLVIEEINRGNCGQIFGDLFQLLDRKIVGSQKGQSEYPIKADVDLCTYLQGKTKNEQGKEEDVLSTSGKKGIEGGNLCLPSNLSILATMNTSDQSLFPMDSAFKRRWDWEYVQCELNDKNKFTIKIGGADYQWHHFLKCANEAIKQVTDSEDKQMGAYFIKSDIEENDFKSKVMYYLWSEICKEEYRTNNNFFRYVDSEDKEHEFTFNDLYKDGSTDVLKKFMHFMMNKYCTKSN